MIDLSFVWFAWFEAFAVLAAGVAVKATLLLLVTLLADRLLHRRLLARSAMWQALVLTLALLPVAEVALPGWRLLSQPSEIARTMIADSTVTAGDSMSREQAAPAAAPTLFAAPANEAILDKVELPGRSEGTELPVDGVSAAATASEWKAVALLAATAAYLAGVLLLMVRLLGSWLRVAALVKSSAPVDEPAWLAALDDCRGRLGIKRPVALRQSEKVGVPVFVGWWRPTILLPTALTNRARPDVVRTALVHELAHARRRDYAWNLLLRLVQAVYWPHPLVWLAGRIIGRVREAACDQVCVYWLGGAEAYRATLVDLAVSRARRPAVSLGMAIARGSRLERRLNELAHGHGLARCLPGVGLRCGLIVSAIAVAALLGSARLRDRTAVADDAPVADAAVAPPDDAPVEKSAEKPHDKSADEPKPDESKDPSENKARIGRPPVRVKVSKVRREDFVVRAVRECVIQPIQQVPLYARAAGIVAERHADLGDEVKKGQVLATLDAPEAAEALAAARSAAREELVESRRAKAGVDAAKAAVEAAKADLAGVQEAVAGAEGAAKYRDTQSQRLDELAKDGSVSTKSRDEANENLRAAQAEVKSKLRAFASAAAEVDRAKAQLKVAEAAVLVAQVRRVAAEEHLARLEASDPLQIKSPLDGRVIQVAANVGSLVAGTGERMPLFIVARTDTFVVKTTLEERDARDLKADDAVTVYVHQLARGVQAKISRVAYSVDGNTSEVTAVLDNPDGHLRPGMHGRLTAPFEVHKDALVVRVDSFSSDNNHPWVWRVVAGRLRKTYVRLGAEVFGDHEILEGLSEGDVVLIKPKQKSDWFTGNGIQENAKVEIDPNSDTDN